MCVLRLQLPVNIVIIEISRFGVRNETWSLFEISRSKITLLKINAYRITVNCFIIARQNKIRVYEIF